MTLELVPWRGARVPLLAQGEVSRSSLAEWMQWVVASQGYMGTPTPVTTYGNRPAESISSSFEGCIQCARYADGPVASVEAYRLRVFGQAPLLYQEIVDGRAGDMFDDDSLDRLRAPWAGATLSDLMKRILIYGDFAGNGFILDLDDELVLIRPDWVEIVLGKRMFRGGQVGWKQLGIMYYEGGLGIGDGVPFLPGEYAHFVPGLPDPLATYRGMSWLTPVIREIRADKSASDHKLAFFENAASPNLAVSLPKEITPDQFERFVARMDEQHKGAVNAYKTLYTGGGADVTVIGSNMQQMDFSSVSGKGETRIANAGGVPPTLLSFSEGMQGSSLNAGNYTAAKRNFVDTTMRDLWSNFAGSVQQMDAFAPPRPKSRLWYDGRDIPFLHEDAKDLAEIQQTRASTINTYVTAGFQPETAVAAIAHDDVMLLQHTGLTSVQLLPPGQTAGGEPVDPEADAELATEADAINGDETVRAFLEVVDELDEIQRDQLREHKGTDIGGRFASTLKGRLSKALDGWLKGEVHADPLAEFNRDQLRTIAKQRGVEIRPRMPLIQLKSAILQHVRDEHGGTHPGHAVQDAMGDRLRVDAPAAKKLDAPKAPGASTGPAAKVDDGLDAMETHRLQGLALEYEVPNAREKSRDELIQDLRKAGATSPATRRAARDAEVKDRVRSAYLAVVARKGVKPREGEFVSLADIRDELPDIDREELDRAITAMDREPGIFVAPVANLKSLTQREREAAVHFGNEDSHAIGMSPAATKAKSGKAQPDSAAKMAELNGMSVLDARDALDSMSRPEVYALAQHLGEKGISKHRKRELADLVLTHHQGDVKPVGGPDGKPDALKAPAASPTGRTVGRDVVDLGEAEAFASSVDAVMVGHVEGRGDDVLGEILRRQGYDGRPEVLAKSAFDSRVAEPGYVEMFRGLHDGKVFGLPEHGRSPADLAEDFRSGKMYVGAGMYGNGVYAASGANAAFAAGKYAGEGGALIRMALKPDAKVADYNDLVYEHEAFMAERRAAGFTSKVYSDLGRYAASRGYDAIRRRQVASGQDHYVLLNRTAVIAEAA